MTFFASETGLAFETSQWIFRLHCRVMKQILIREAELLRPQLQQHGEEPDTFRVKGLCSCNWFCLLESHGTSLLSTGPYWVTIKTILVLTLEIHSCMCLCVSKQPPDVGMYSCSMALWQMLNASVGLGAPWGRKRRGCSYKWRYIYVHIYIYTYAHVCMLAT